MKILKSLAICQDPLLTKRAFFCYSGHKLLAICCISVGDCFVTSKTRISFLYNNLCIRAASWVAERPKTSALTLRYLELRNVGWEKLHFKWGQGLVTNLPLRNQFLALAVKTYGKGDIRVFWSCPILNFLTLCPIAIFCSGL